MLTTDNELAIVLVHGGWSDGSCWSKVIAHLQKQGYNATAAQLSLTSFEADVLSLCQHIESHPAPRVLLVGHSYGGAVITEAAPKYESIIGLVYVAASAPVAGQSFGDFMQAHPSPTPVPLTPDTYGLLWADRAAFTDCLGHDLSAQENELLYAVQKPVSSMMFGSSVSVEGWREKPCCYVVAEEDRLFAPADQVALAKQMNATTRFLSSGHFVPQSRPVELAELLIECTRAFALAGCSEPKSDSERSRS